MKASMILMAMLAIGMSVVASEGTYNILSIDGGGIRGIIPAGILIKIEKFASKYAKEKGYNVPKYKDKNDESKELELVHMKDMFDMMAGTSTGSIIAAALSYPNPDDKDKEMKDRRPWYFMEEIMGIYTKTGDKIFVASRSSAVTGTLIFILFIATCATIGYLINFNYFNASKEEEKLRQVSELSQRPRLSKKAKDENMCKVRELTEKLLIDQLE